MPSSVRPDAKIEALRGKLRQTCELTRRIIAESRELIAACRDRAARDGRP
jgi:hypothetical protein